MVSVIIPAYNVHPYLAAAIDSALRQTYRNLEVIVVDDGSTDGTHEVAESYDKRVRCIRQANRGAAAARNAGIRVAAGKYIAFLDGDDYWEDNKLEAQVGQFNADLDLGMVYADYGTFGPHGVIAANNPVAAGFNRPSGLILRELFFECLVWTGTVVVKRDVLEAVGLFDETLLKAEDYDMWLRIAAAFRVRHLPRVVAWYRIRTDSLTKTPQDTAEEWEPRVLSACLGRCYAQLGTLPTRLVKKRLALAHFLQGYRAFWRGDLTVAVDCFGRALVLRPFSIRLAAYLLLAHAKWLAFLLIRARQRRTPGRG